MARLYAEHILIKWYIFREIARKYDSALWTKQALVYMHYYTFCHITQYSLWKGIFFQIITIRSTFSWTFIDVFIMLVTTAFALRVKQFTFKVEILAKSKANNIKLWKKLRQEYYQLYQLCCLLNNKLTYIIFLSYGTNMYFILMQLFGSMKHLTSTLRKVYYYMSFFLLIARLLGVTLFGASVSNESGKILPLLFSVPSPSYNKEVERLIDQVTKNEIVISVMNFFKVNKALLFKFTGVLVTYELALMQFNTYSLNTDETISRLTDQVLYIEIALSGKRFFTVRKRAVLTIAGIVATYQLVLNQLNTQIVPNFNTDSSSNKTAYPKN
ncbi:gustatory receptor for sugar taste 64f-like [Zophobas morio]|uniref:gustatory receptor for sugar taste 64f-like n=1 Tax=Zophobas morio TaxID=2755281 RepID=UPI0030834DBE